MNEVSFLLENEFNSLSWEDKLKIKQLGRPMPDLSIQIPTSSRKKQYFRQFNMAIYNKTKWICGCEKRNALFCFPCLLFVSEVKESAWTSTGVTDLGHLTQNIKRHEISKRHLSNEVRLGLLGKTDIKKQLVSTYWANIQKHNAQVNKNRHILSRIIDSIKFCGAFELSLRGHDENDMYKKPGIFCGLVNFAIELDNALHEHLDTFTSFKGKSKDLQDELLEYMVQVRREKILTEINEAKYFAVMVDEVTDVTSQYQMVIVLRYMHNGNPVERFWGFINPEKSDAESLAASIHSVIDPLLANNPNKLVAQTYDAAALMSGKYKGVHAIIQQKYPLAHFMHCYPHQLHLLISQAVSQNKEVRIFFSNIDRIVNFFSHRIDIFNKILLKKLPRGSHTMRTFKRQSINIIYNHRDTFAKCMQIIQKSFTNSKIISQASVIELLLDDKVFLFWLNIFHHIMPHVDALYDQLQKKEADAIYIKSAVKKFENCIRNIRENIDNIIEGRDPFMEASEPPSKRIKVLQDNGIFALEVCDIIIQTITDRFKYVDHLDIALLFCSEQFDSYSRSVSIQKAALNTIKSAYPGVISSEQLQSELSIIYAYPDFQQFKSVMAFLNIIKSNNLEDIFKETTKLLELIITIPMTTTESERCFCTLKRIKNFLFNTVGENRLATLCTLSIENSLLSADLDFNTKVVERYANAVKSRIELIYKK